MASLSVTSTLKLIRLSKTDNSKVIINPMMICAIVENYISILIGNEWIDINRNFDDSINRPDYARKLYLIEKCIYGVDIQSIAVQISKLRFFISLVVDQKPTSDRADNLGIRPLPNLEAKFVAANTLIGLKKEKNLFDNRYIDKLQSKRWQYYLMKNSWTNKRQRNINHSKIICRNYKKIHGEK